MPDGFTEWMMRDVFGEVSAMPSAPSWFAEAACDGSGLDDVEPGSKDAIRAALANCGRCPVREACGATSANIDAKARPPPTAFLAA